MTYTGPKRVRLPGRRLTLWQAHLLTLAANGYTNAAIAHKCSIDPVSVPGTLRKAYLALGAADRTNAVAIALCLDEINEADITITVSDQKAA